MLYVVHVTRLITTYGMITIVAGDRAKATKAAIDKLEAQWSRDRAHWYAGPDVIQGAQVLHEVEVDYLEEKPQ